ncbi:MAG: helix-turn-helix domain-containing protein [Acidobacteriota bacterium]
MNHNFRHAYSTRQLAQMWNVSESTVKRWADSGDLHCRRTPGGHRRFTLQDIHTFQLKRGFEANGLLANESWEDPDVEVSVNQRNFAKVCDQVFYLASRNQRLQIKELLERLYLRGVELVQLYDDVLMPVLRKTRAALNRRELVKGHDCLVGNNLEESMSYLFPEIIRRRPNGRMVLCAAPDSGKALLVNAISRILEVEGWESLNLGHNVSFSVMAEIVRLEPVSLVCVVSERKSQQAVENNQVSPLSGTAAEYRIPVLLFGSGFSSPEHLDPFDDCYYFRDFSSLRNYVVSLARP